MAIFSVYGPCQIPVSKKPKARLISEDLSPFWERHEEVASSKGCYIFAIRAGRGFTPLYVGKTTDTFKTECFTPSKLEHYHRALADYIKGTPVLFFIVHPPNQGATNRKAITQIEDFLIQAGRMVNPNLRNIRGGRLPKWGIKGVIRAGQGGISESEKQFRRLMGIKKQ